MIDLHVHTTFSDGEHLPDKVVEIAKLYGVEVISITDHDSCEGIEDAIEKGEELGIKVIPGIEVTAYENQEIHVLGYNVNYKSNKLSNYYQELKDILRIEENRIFEAFNNWGYLVRRDELVNKYSSDNIITPGNFVDWLIDNGFFNDKVEAFEKFFIHSELRYRKKDRMNVKEAIEFIRSINGIPVLAHPVRLKEKDELLIEKIKCWKAAGLAGIEAIYSLNSDEENEQYLNIAKDMNLGITIGSDYHGEHVKPNIEIGAGIEGRMNKYSGLECDVRSFLNIN